MNKLSLMVPMITAAGAVKPAQISREFQGALPVNGVVAFVASIIREGLESAQYPDYRNLNALADEYLVQEAALVEAVPDHVWIRNGFYPLGDWQEARPG
jgi:hypothetical protein